MEVYTFKMVGIVHRPDYDYVSESELQKKTYIYEATSFQKAVTKAKKVFKHIHSVQQITGEILEQ